MSQQNELLEALGRADKESSQPLGRSLVNHSKGSVTLSPSSMIVERLKITKVDIKIEVSAFIERHFIGRTQNDGTIIELSKEKLIENLTELFYGLEENASNIKEDNPKERPLRGKSSIKEETIPEDK